jgi:hypothetical protein
MEKKRRGGKVTGIAPVPEYNFVATDGLCSNYTADFTVRSERFTPATNIPTDAKKDMIVTNGLGTLMLTRLNTQPQNI